MPDIQFFGHFDHGFRNRIHKVLIEYNLRCGVLFAGSTYLPEGDLARPRKEVGSLLEINELLTDRQAGFL